MEDCKGGAYAVAPPLQLVLSEFTSRNPETGCLAQLGERRPYKANVGGSIPSAPTI